MPKKAKRDKVDAYQLLLRFVLGGGVVLAATVIADLGKNPYVTGLAICFPSMLLAGAVALRLAGHPPGFIGSYFLASLGGLVIVAVFAASASLMVRWHGFGAGIVVALLIWFALTTAAVFLQRLVS